MDVPPLRTVQVHEAGGLAVVALIGEHDLSTVPALETLLDGLVDGSRPGRGRPDQ
jgi:hypothetical protein